MKTTAETTSFLVLNAVLVTVAALALILPASCVRSRGATPSATTTKTGTLVLDGAAVAYETRGTGGRPLVLLHDGACTLDTCLGGALPALAATRQVVAIRVASPAADPSTVLASLGLVGAGAEVFVLSTPAPASSAPSAPRGATEPAAAPIPVQVAMAMPLLRSM